jgi:serine/threonine protein kinase
MNERYRQLEVLRNGVHKKTAVLFDTVLQTKCIGKWTSKKAPPLLQAQRRQEARILSMLDSFWIPDLLDFLEDKDGFLVVEKFYEGPTLSAYLKQKPSRSMRKRIFVQIVQLIEMVHAAGYVYMDLKPENIIICRHHACLIDFDAAVPKGSSKAVLANALAMPPEAVNEGVLSEKSDQIGLGRLYQKMLGSGLLSWICLQKDPARRFSSLSSLKEHAGMSKRKAVLIKGAFAFLCLLSVPAAGIYSLSEAQSAKSPESYSASKLYEMAVLDSLPALFFENSQMLEIVCEKAIESESSLLARWLFENRQDVIAAKDPLLLLQVAFKSWKLPKAPALQKIAQSIPDSSASCDHLETFCTLLLYFDYADDGLLFEKLARAMESCSAWNEKSAQVCMEYLLLAKSRGYVMSLPSSLQQTLQKNEQLMELFDLYRRSN